MKWLNAAVARIFHPGCNFQNALILKGEQNIGKSYILEKLGGEWYGVLSDSVDDPHAIDAIQNVWLIKLKEMSAMHKAEVNLKNLLLNVALIIVAPLMQSAPKFPDAVVFLQLP